MLEAYYRVLGRHNAYLIARTDSDDEDPMKKNDGSSSDEDQPKSGKVLEYDEEKENFLACNHIGMMIDHCEKMINLAKNADQPLNSAEKLINSGIVKSNLSNNLFTSFSRWYLHQ